MKKYILLLITFVLLVTSCEKDDICIERTTPFLIIRFYDAVNTENVKAVSSLTAGNDEYGSLYEEESIDSIALPLNIYENYTDLLLKSATLTDTLSLTYARNDVFVSRSCGYKTIFDNLELSKSTHNWIKNIELKTTIIENDTASHIAIYH